MRGKDWWADVALVAALVALVLAIVCLGTQFLWDRTADERVRTVMDQAQARIDLYEAASIPATERPAKTPSQPPADSPLVKGAEGPRTAQAPLEKGSVAAEGGDGGFTMVAVEPVEDWYIPELPLDKQLQRAVFEAACGNGVDYFTALSLIRVESDFRTDAVNPVSGCYGLCQLNPAWFPSGLTPAENIRAGMEYLGELIKQYDGDVPAALRAYNRGFDDGDRAYSTAVLAAREEIMETAGVTFP